MHATAMPQSPPTLARAVQEVCRLIAACDEIASVRLATVRRQPYPELIRLKVMAARHGLVLTVASDGGVVVRRPARAGGASIR